MCMFKFEKHWDRPDLHINRSQMFSLKFHPYNASEERINVEAS